MSRAEVIALVAEDLAKVERAIELDTVCSVEAVTAISRHLQASGGKRLRPLLVLLTARAWAPAATPPCGWAPWWRLSTPPRLSTTM